MLINEIGTINNGFDTDGNGFTSGDFYVELFNSSGSAVDISGWEIREITNLAHTIPAGTILPAGGYFTAAQLTSFGTPTATPNVLGGLAAYANFSGLSDTDVITLYDPNTDTYVVFAGDDATGTGLTNAVNAILADHPTATQVGTTERGIEDTSGSSGQRDGDGEDVWINAPPTPGAANLCFGAETLIATPKGEVIVANLKIGDLILTAKSLQRREKRFRFFGWVDKR